MSNATAYAWASHEDVTVATTVGGSTSINMSNARGARILVPSGSSITSITFYETDSDVPDDNATWYECSGASETVTVDASAGNVSYPVPDSLFALMHVRLVGDVAGVVRLVRKG